MEYLVHRYVLHVAFPRGSSWHGRILHRLFDASHADHHAKPWDGYHINGHLDTLFVAVWLVPLSFLAPPHTASVAVAAPVRRLRGRGVGAPRDALPQLPRGATSSTCGGGTCTTTAVTGSGRPTGSRATSGTRCSARGSRLPQRERLGPRGSGAGPEPGSRTRDAATRALVTGASAGLGREMARQLGRRGFRVARDRAARGRAARDRAARRGSRRRGAAARRQRLRSGARRRPRRRRARALGRARLARPQRRHRRRGRRARASTRSGSPRSSPPTCGGAVNWLGPYCRG